MIAQSPVIEIFKTPPPKDGGWIFVYEGDMSIYSLRVLARTYATIDFVIYVQTLEKEPVEDLQYFFSRVYSRKVTPIVK